MLLAVDCVCQDRFFPPNSGLFVVFITLPSEIGAQMITWAVPRFSDHSPSSGLPQPWLQREGGPRYPLSPTLVPCPIKGPKQQKLGCCHNLLCQSAITKSYRVNTSRIQSLASLSTATMLLQFKFIALSPWITAAKPVLVFLPSYPSSFSTRGKKQTHKVDNVIGLRIKSKFFIKV